jgi:hypothetical protein
MHIQIIAPVQRPRRDQPQNLIVQRPPQGQREANRAELRADAREAMDAHLETEPHRIELPVALPLLPDLLEGD